MKQSKLIKMKADEQGCHIWTVSYNGKSPRKFFVLREEADKIEKEGRLIVRDLNSFADIRVREESDRQKKIQLQIFWLESVGEDYKGKMERICIPYEKFQEAFQGGNTLIKCLELEESKLPKIIFNSRKNLKEVVKHPKLRKKLGKFLSRHFLYPGTAKIVLYDDSVPYSFYFQEYRLESSSNPEIVGGVILHEQEDFATAQYGIHT